MIKGTSRGVADQEASAVLNDVVEDVEIAQLIRVSTQEVIGINKNVFVIGRKLGKADYSIDNPFVSKKHAQIICLKDGYYLEDFGTVNGTYLNNHKIEVAKKEKLKNGDLLMKFAEEIFVFEVKYNQSVLG